MGQLVASWEVSVVVLVGVTVLFLAGYFLFLLAHHYWLTRAVTLIESMHGELPRAMRPTLYVQRQIEAAGMSDETFVKGCIELLRHKELDERRKCVRLLAAWGHAGFPFAVWASGCCRSLSWSLEMEWDCCNLRHSTQTLHWRGTGNAPVELPPIDQKCS